MKILYLECNMGAAGDMLMSALYELLPDKVAFVRTMNSLGLPGVTLSPLSARTCGIAGTRMEVTVGGQEEASLDVPWPPLRGISTFTPMSITSTSTSTTATRKIPTVPAMTTAMSTIMSTSTVIITITTPLPAISLLSSVAFPCLRR